MAAKAGRGLYYEYQMKAFENWLKTQDTNKGALAGIEKRVGLHYRYVYLKQAMSKCGYAAPNWDSQNTAIRTLGTAFVVLAQEETNYFTLEATMETPSELIPTEQFTEAWQRNEDNMLEHARQSCPMIIPPKDWTSYEDGGYYGDLASFTSLLRLKYLDTIFGKQYKRRLMQLDIPQVYKAVNSIQATLG